MTADTLRPPPLYVLDDVPLGRRADGAIDHSAALKALQQLDVRRIKTLQVIKGASAEARFGGDAVNGVVIIKTITDTVRATPRVP